ncbi:MAG: branched-chain amino acid ABC transporter permease [Hyphomicrobiaceae bacterium]|nr:MAG: branched-chain amino acid ABC transporter permease [Hyphomicrobiaceae bacterium]
MFYREVGQFKTSYAADQAMFPIAQDRYFVLLLILAAFVVPPAFLGTYWFNAVLIPFMIFAMAALGLNLLVGYCGQISLGTGGFMAVGAYASYKLTTAFFPDLGMIFIFLMSGAIAAAVGVVFGLPSLRIKGFYLAVATLASQFFLVWLFNRVPWFYNFNTNGTIESPPRTLFGSIMEPGGTLDFLSFLNPLITSPRASPVTKYLFALSLVVVFALLAKNLVRGRIGRSWMAIRDMDIAAELIGIRPMQTKLLAFAISSFYCGLAGAMLLNLYLNSAETQAFYINVSFDVLFMVIIGGLGSIMGSLLGAAFIVLTPIFLTNALPAMGLAVDTATQKHIEQMLFGGIMIFFLIVEPHGLARLWQIGKEKLRLWPFPH